MGRLPLRIPALDVARGGGAMVGVLRARAAVVLLIDVVSLFDHSGPEVERFPRI